MIEEEPNPRTRNEADERTRLQALRHYRILDSGSEERFDKIVDLAAKVIDAPVAHLSFIDEDRQYFKANVGADVKEIPRQDSICDHCMRAGSMLEVEDLSEHPLFKDNPLVKEPPHARSYLGVPIIDREGHALGSLCVVDTEVRGFDDKDRLLLREQAENVMTLLEARLQEKLKEEAEEGLSQKVMEAEDALRKKVGEDLHDGLGQNLGALRMFLDQLKDTITPVDQERYETCMESIEGVLKEAIKEARRVSHDLTLKGIEEKPLEDALIGLVLPLERGTNKLEVTFEPDMRDDPSPFVKKNLYRIVQEMIGNTVRHSGASKLKVQLIQEQGSIQLHYCDNGKGLEAGGGSDGKGLDSIRGRVEALKGQLNLEASADAGLAYAIRVPFQ